jgi:hypothetical protein
VPVGPVNRSERRRRERAGEVVPKPATPADAKRLIDDAFRDRISWTAARILLERVTNDVAWSQLDDGLRAAIARFLERHPKA